MLWYQARCPACLRKHGDLVASGDGLASGHREHATHLTKYLRDTLTCIERSHNHPVPVDPVKLIVNGTISLIAKFQRIPDLSNINDSLQVMQTEAETEGRRPHKL